MSSLYIENVLDEKASGDAASERPSRISVDFVVDDTTYSTYFSSSDIPLTANAEACVSAALVPAMKLGKDIKLSKKLNETYSKGTDHIQTIFSEWYPTFKVVHIDSDGLSTDNARKGRRVATCFTGGVDSFYTLLKHQEEVTDILYVHGYDIKLDNRELREQTTQMLRRVGKHFNKNVIEIETNLRHFFWGTNCKWGPECHGAALAAIGHLIAPDVCKLYIPSSFAIGDKFNRGSHPELDHNWGSDQIDFVHDGCEARRIDKVGEIAKSELALQNLRVCFKNRAGMYNCGRCEKCTRTMLSLKAYGVLDDCTTFAEPLDIKDIKKLWVDDDVTRALINENIEVLRENKVSPELQTVLAKIQKRPRWQKPWFKLLATLEREAWKRKEKWKKNGFMRS